MIAFPVFRTIIFFPNDFALLRYKLNFENLLSKNQRCLSLELPPCAQSCEKREQTGKLRGEEALNASLACTRFKDKETEAQGDSKM